MLFNISLNDLLTVPKILQLYIFADNNTISAVPKSTDDLLIILKIESELAVKWFRENNMIVNPENFRQWFCKERIKIVKLIIKHR